MQGGDLNLYEFYREVALRFEREVLGNPQMTQARHDHLHQVLGQLQTEYFQDDAIDYGDPDRMVAYTFSFAPKHALVWRELGKTFTFEADDKAIGWNLNSVGPGPGSDLIGMLCGLPEVEQVSVSAVGLESEEGWRLMFEFARDEFIARTGISFEALMTSDPANLHSDGQTIGSFVLSDAARSNTLKGLLEGLRDNTSGTESWFLDFPSYTCPTSGKTYMNKAVEKCGFGCSYRYVPQMGLGIGNAISAQIDECDPIYCKRKVSEDPKVNFMTVRLR